MQIEEPVFSAELSAPLPVPTSSSTAATRQQQLPAAAAMGRQEEEEELDSEVSLKLDAACFKVFSCLTGVLERCVVLTGAWQQQPARLVGCTITSSSQ